MPVTLARTAQATGAGAHVQHALAGVHGRHVHASMLPMRRRQHSR